LLSADIVTEDIGSSLFCLLMVSIDVQEVWKSHLSLSCSMGGKWPLCTWPCRFTHREKNQPVSSHLELSGLGSWGDTQWLIGSKNPLAHCSLAPCWLLWVGKIHCG
jgi:hypothetical protein